MRSSPNTQQSLETSDGNGFRELRIAAFESRRADDMQRLIEKHRGQAFVSPSMREVPFDDVAPLIDFANRVMTGQLEILILLTGVGFRHLMKAVVEHVDEARFIDSLRDIHTVARGPKPVAAMKEYGLTPSYRVPEPNTWRELLETLDASLPISNQTVALQEYGVTNRSLLAGLEARGAQVLSLRVYEWGFPNNTDALDQNIRALAAREREMCLFTAAQQVVHLLGRAEQLGLRDKVITGLRQSVVCSIGPSTSEMLRSVELPVDFEPSHPKMGQLVAESATQSQDLRRRKERVIVSLSGPTSDVMDKSAPWYDSLFMKACRREPCETTPIWLMRQAGRYMPEYREIRAKTTFLELCKSPELCAEIMVGTVKRLGVDAAIIFSDLLPILEPMGLELEYAKGEGPIIHNPVREVADIDRVLELESVASLDFVMETVRQTRNELPADIPLIGFAGAPFTLASYVIEGGASRNYLHTKTLMYRDPGAWRELMQRFVRSVTLYLNAQIAAGAQAVQLFDSWAGCLSTRDYREYVLPHVKEIISGITPGVPVINFATGNPALLPQLAEARPAVVGVDWRTQLDDAWETIGYDFAVQGNLDPLVLMADRDTIVSRAQEILKMVNGRPGHIFNLGHGIIPQIPVDNVIALVDAVHEWRN